MFIERDGILKPVGKGCLIIEFGNEDLTIPENEKIIDELIQEVKKIRGEIISKSIDIEYLLNELIGVFFFGQPSDDFQIFLAAILQKEFFTFAEKMNVLNYLLTNHPERFFNIGNKKRKEIITLIREIMEFRNKFAHQDITINFKEKKAYIVDKRGINLLSQESINGFHEKLHSLSLFLSLLLLTRMYHTSGQTMADLEKDMDDFLKE